MTADVMRKRNDDGVRQFSIFASNRVGRLNDIILKLAQQEIHIMAVCTLDATDTTIIRLIVDYWEQAQRFFDELGLAYELNEVLAVEIDSEQDIKYVTCALTQAEISIHYVYPMLARPKGKSALVLNLEDNDMATDILTTSGIRVLGQSDIAR